MTEIKTWVRSLLVDSNCQYSEIIDRGLRPSTVAGSELEIRSLRSSSLRLRLRRTGCRGLHVARSPVVSIVERVRSGKGLQSTRFTRRSPIEACGHQQWLAINLPTVQSGGPRAPEAESKIRIKITIRRRNSGRVHQGVPSSR